MSQWLIPMTLNTILTRWSSTRTLDARDARTPTQACYFHSAPDPASVSANVCMDGGRLTLATIGQRWNIRVAPDQKVVPQAASSAPTEWDTGTSPWRPYHA